VALSLIREPRSAALETREVAGFGAIMASLPRILVNDRPFLRLIIVRVVSGFVTMASAFYIVFATQELGLALASTGLFVSAQVAGSLTSGLVMGALQDRWGPRIHMRVMMLISMMSPLLALLMKPLAATLGTAVLYPYLLVFFFMGIYMSNTGWPYFNWILEYAPETQRPLYIGIINTLAALTMLAPVLGGWLTGLSYATVFITATAFAVLALLLSTTLPSTRQARPTQGDLP
jgi:MFS family permease